MTGFQSRDRAGNPVDFGGVGGTADFKMLSAVLTAPPVEVGFEHQLVTTAGTLTNVGSAVAAGATEALVTVMPGFGDLRWRPDGVNPTAGTTATAGTGLYTAAGNALLFLNLGSVRVVAVAGTAVLDIAYRRYVGTA